MNFIIDIPWYVRNWFIKNCVIRTQIKKIYYYILFLNKFTNDSLFCWYKVQFKYAHKFVFKSNYKVINNVLIIQLLILKKIFKKFNYLTKQSIWQKIQNISFPIKIFLLIPLFFDKLENRI